LIKEFKAFQETAEKLVHHLEVKNLAWRKIFEDNEKNPDKLYKQILKDEGLDGSGSTKASKAKAKSANVATTISAIQDLGDFDSIGDFDLTTSSKGTKGGKAKASTGGAKATKSKAKVASSGDASIGSGKYIAINRTPLFFFIAYSININHR
jgi:hypothetical protein